MNHHSVALTFEQPAYTVNIGYWPRDSPCRNLIGGGPRGYSTQVRVQFPQKQLKLIILPELPTAAREFFRHEYMHKSNPTDGEIFRQVLVAEHERDETAAACWSAMLTARKRRNLTELKKIDGGGLLAAITPLLPFAALWVDFQPGALNRVLPMRCREVRIVDQLHLTWSQLTVR
jgi:hypothetical protein